MRTSSLLESPRYITLLFLIVGTKLKKEGAGASVEIVSAEIPCHRMKGSIKTPPCYIGYKCKAKVAPIRRQPIRVICSRTGPKFIYLMCSVCSKRCIFFMYLIYTNLSIWLKTVTNIVRWH